MPLLCCIFALLKFLYYTSSNSLNAMYYAIVIPFVFLLEYIDKEWRNKKKLDADSRNGRIIRRNIEAAIPKKLAISFLFFWLFRDCSLILSKILKISGLNVFFSFYFLLYSLLVKMLSMSYRCIVRKSAESVEYKMRRVSEKKIDKNKRLQRERFLMN